MFTEQPINQSTNQTKSLIVNCCKAATYITDIKNKPMKTAEIPTATHEKSSSS